MEIYLGYGDTETGTGDMENKTLEIWRQEHCYIE